MTYPPTGGPGPGFGPGDPHTAATIALAGAQQRSRRRLTIILSALVVILGLVLVFAANQVIFNKTGKALIPALTLRSADDPGPDPFTASVALVNKTQPIQPRVETAQNNGVRAVNGTAAGLYATTGTASCDAASLGNQLAANPAAARAWAGVQGIRTSDIPWYLNSLTPVVLTADTWVTNYSFRSGSASAYQAVLQSGTPVFVDAAGVPRAVCACGNPLRPPANAPIGGYRVTGSPWTNYTVNNTYRVTYNNTYVTNNTIVNQPAPAPAAAPVLQLIDARTQTLIDQRVGDILELPAEQPADLPNFLANAFEANAAPSFGSDDEAQEQGLVAAGSTEADQAVAQRATENGGQPATDQPSAGGTVPGDQQNPLADGSPQSPGAPGGTETPQNTEVPSETGAPAPAPTQFRGTGDAIGTLVYRDADGTTVTCTLPPTFESSTVAATNSDCTLTFHREDLLEPAVTPLVDADTHRVWRITPIGHTTAIEVLEAQWQTLTSATSTTEAPTTEAPTTEAPTTEAPATSQAPATTEPSAAVPSS